MEQRPIQFLLIVFLLTLSIKSGSLQLSRPKTSDTPEIHEENKYRQRKADLDSTQDDEISTANHCSFDLHMKWMTEVSSTVYGTPLITDLFSDGHKEIVVPAFSSYLEVLEAEDGARAVGWPGYHRANSHSSPFMFDIDRDGILDIGIATYQGEIIWFKDTGDRMPQTLYIPKLRVKKDWHVGVNPDPTDHRHPDVGDGNVFEAHKQDPNAGDNRENSTAAGAAHQRRLMLVTNGNGATVEEHDGGISQEATDSFQVFKDDETFDSIDQDFGEKHEQGLYHYDMDDYNAYGQYAADDFWDDEDWGRTRPHNPLPVNGAGSTLYLDAHVLASPVLADLDGDGLDDLVVPVTYFFDEDYYKEHKDELDKEIDTSKYLASGIVVFDLFHQFVKWEVHLELTTDTIEYRAYIFTPPSIVDIDEDGLMEIVVGTSQGFLYILNHDGSNRNGWPIQMGQIEGQVLVDDVNGDGKIEIVAGDRRGSVAMFDIHGKEIWERHLRSSIAQAITAGDIDGDGQIEIVVGSASGNVFALRGVDGGDKSPFPFRTHGKIMSPILLVKLKEGPSQQMVFTSYDGFLYVIDGETGCADAADFGEISYSMVLADDLNDDGFIDLVVTSLNGNVYLYETGGKYSPMRSWTSERHGISGLVSRDELVGISADEDSRAKRDVRGDGVAITFEIIDNRHPRKRKKLDLEDKNKKGEKRVTTSHGPYNVTVLLKNVGVKEMNAGNSPIIGVMEVYDLPGTYTVTIPCPKSRSTAVVRLEMKDKNKILFVDEFSLSFHMHWYKLMKWIIFIPFLSMAAVVLGSKAINQNLPS